MIATRIADMKQHMQVTDKESGQLRPLRYSDIVILLRSLKDYGTDFCAGSAGSGDTGICGIFDRIFFGIGSTDGAGNAADSG